MSDEPAWDLLMRALTLERFGRPVPEWHNTPPMEADGRALRLVWADEHDERRTA